MIWWENMTISRRVCAGPGGAKRASRTYARTPRAGPARCRSPRACTRATCLCHAPGLGSDTVPHTRLHAEAREGVRTDPGDDGGRGKLLPNAACGLDEGRADVDRDAGHVLPLGRNRKRAERIGEGHDKPAVHGLWSVIAQLHRAQDRRIMEWTLTPTRFTDEEGVWERRRAGVDRVSRMLALFVFGNAQRAGRTVVRLDLE